MFTLVFIRFVNHDMLVQRGEDMLWIKAKASPTVIVLGSLAWGFLFSWVSLLVYATGEFFVNQLGSQKFPSRSTRLNDRYG